MKETWGHAGGGHAGGLLSNGQRLTRSAHIGGEHHVGLAMQGTLQCKGFAEGVMEEESCRRGSAAGALQRRRLVGGAILTELCWRGPDGDFMLSGSCPRGHPRGGHAKGKKQNGTRWSDHASSGLGYGRGEFTLWESCRAPTCLTVIRQLPLRSTAFLGFAAAARAGVALTA